MRHNPAFVRINPYDGSLHCERHGLLTEEEAVVAIAQAGVSASKGVAIDGRTPRLVRWLLDHWGKRRHAEACRP